VEDGGTLSPSKDGLISRMKQGKVTKER